jgi:pyruvate formate lyase activating enzyme
MAVEIGGEQGLRHVYPGNLHDGEADTRCAGCEAILIRRRGFSVVENRLADGACPACGRRLAGVGLDGHGR